MRKKLSVTKLYYILIHIASNLSRHLSRHYLFQKIRPEVCVHPFTRVLSSFEQINREMRQFKL